jgi:acyl-CoA carboxylase subunit beta
MIPPNPSAAGGPVARDPGGTLHIGAHALLELLCDHGTFEPWDDMLNSHGTEDSSSAYADTLAEARGRTGMREAVTTGLARIRGRQVVLVISEFGFLGGSIGVAYARAVCAAMETATRRRLPIVAAIASGGTRMQEGTAAFLQMLPLTAAVAKHKAAGLPYLVYLRHPTTGGVLASWGSLGQVTFAEPGAMIGFLGPRVVEALRGQRLPTGVQSAETLVGTGVVDAVVRPEDLAGTLDRTLGYLDGSSRRVGPRPSDALAVAQGRVVDSRFPTDPWDSVQRTRRQDRPGLAELLRHGATRAMSLRGTAGGEPEEGFEVHLATFGTTDCVVMGHARPSPGSPEFELGPNALRRAVRAIELATELRLPLVSVLDTPGAVISAKAERVGLARRLAECLQRMMTAPCPTLTVLLGQGSGGGALALFPADMVLAARHAWLAPLPPEGASAIVHRTPAHAAEMARTGAISSAHLRHLGAVDVLVDERPDAADEPTAFCQRMGREIAFQLADLVAQDMEKRMGRRDRRIRQLTRIGLPQD